MGKLIIAFFMGVALTACLGSAYFPFKYYALDSESYEGKLRGPTEDKDLLLSMCRPTEADKAPCLVMFASDYLRMKSEFIKCQIDLDAAQRCQ
jgi:hypothetical protein